MRGERGEERGEVWGCTRGGGKTKRRQNERRAAEARPGRDAENRHARGPERAEEGEKQAKGKTGGQVERRNFRK